MNMNSCIIIIDERRMGGMLNAARKLGGQVTGIVVGSRALADQAAGLAFDKVLHCETVENVPAEAYAAPVAATVAALNPTLVLSSDVPVARIMLGAVAAKLNAAIVSAVRAVAPVGESVVITRSAAEGKVVESITASDTVAGIFDGEDVDVPAAAAVAVETVAVTPNAMRLLETIETEGGAGLATAARVVGAGSGISAKDDLHLIEELAQAMGAEIGCTLPLCDDLRWYPSHRVLGSTHIQVAPDLYIAVGISGQPQHLAGVRDSKIVVAINNDPENRFFKNCNYGILGDLYKIVPELISAFKKIV